MDFNELIEKEIESRAEEKCKEYKQELEQKFEYLKKDLAEQYKFQMTKILNSIKDKISDFSFEYISDKVTNSEAKDIADTYFYNKKPSKCNFPDCKNYRNGTLDDICANCDSHIIKKQKDEKCSKNLENSAAVKNLKKEQDEKDFDSATQAEDEYTKMYGDYSNKENKQDSLKSKVQSVIAASDKEYTEKESEKLVNETIKTISPLLDVFGITEEEVQVAREKMKDPKYREEAENFVKKFGLNLL